MPRKFSRFTCGKSAQQGYSLIELLVVLAILAMLIATLLPPINDVVHKGRLLKSFEIVAAAGGTWCRNNPDSVCTAIGPGIARPSAIDMADFPITLTEDELLDLEKHLNGVLPREDAWNRPIEYRTDINVPPFPLMPPDMMPSRLMVRMANSTGIFEDSYEWLTKFPFTEREPDVVWVNCTWVQLPNV